MEKFWVLMHKDRLVLSWGSSTTMFSRSVVCPEFSLGRINSPAVFNDYEQAKKSAQAVIRSFGGDCYVLESVAIASFPIKIESL